MTAAHYEAQTQAHEAQAQHEAQEAHEAQAQAQAHHEPPEEFNRLASFAAGTFDSYRKNEFSQNGEDGIVREIFRRLGMLRRGEWAFECGALDGMTFSNTFSLVRDHGFRVLAVEGDAGNFKDLERLAEEHGSIVPINEWLRMDRDSIGDILERHDVPSDFALMSIDIDSFDYHAWRNLSDHWRPVVVVIEIDSSILPGRHVVYGQGDGGAPGTSFSSMLELGRSKGYTLVAHTGNMIFVRNDYASRLRMKPLDVRNPDKLFCYNWITTPMFPNRRH